MRGENLSDWRSEAARGATEALIFHSSPLNGFAQYFLTWPARKVTIARFFCNHDPPAFGRSRLEIVNKLHQGKIGSGKVEEQWRSDLRDVHSQMASQGSAATLERADAPGALPAALVVHPGKHQSSIVPGPTIRQRGSGG